MKGRRPWGVASAGGVRFAERERQMKAETREHRGVSNAPTQTPR